METMIQEQRLRGIVLGYDFLCSLPVDVLCTEWKQWYRNRGSEALCLAMIFSARSELMSCVQNGNNDTGTEALRCCVWLWSSLLAPSRCPVYRMGTMIQEQRLRGVVFGYDLLCPFRVDVMCTEWKQLYRNRGSEVLCLAMIFSARSE